MGKDLKYVDDLTMMFMAYADQKGLNLEDVFVVAACTASNIARASAECGAFKLDGPGWLFLAEYSAAMARKDEDAVNELMEWKVPQRTRSQ